MSSAPQSPCRANMPPGPPGDGLRLTPGNEADGGDRTLCVLGSGLRPQPEAPWEERGGALTGPSALCWGLRACCRAHLSGAPSDCPPEARSHPVAGRVWAGQHSRERNGSETFERRRFGPRLWLQPILSAPGSTRPRSLVPGTTSSAGLGPFRPPGMAPDARQTGQANGLRTK